MNFRGHTGVLETLLRQGWDAEELLSKAQLRVMLSKAGIAYVSDAEINTLFTVGSREPALAYEQGILTKVSLRDIFDGLYRCLFGFSLGQGGAARGGQGHGQVAAGHNVNARHFADHVVSNAALNQKERVNAHAQQQRASSGDRERREGVAAPLPRRGESAGAKVLPPASAHSAASGSTQSGHRSGGAGAAASASSSSNPSKSVPQSAATSAHPASAVPQSAMRGASARPLGAIRENDDWRKQWSDRATELEVCEDNDPAELPIDRVVASPSPKHKKKHGAAGPSPQVELRASYGGGFL